MSKSNDDNKPISAKKFMQEFRRYQKGSVTRRHFLGVTGLGTAFTPALKIVLGFYKTNSLPCELSKCIPFI